MSFEEFDNLHVKIAAELGATHGAKAARVYLTTFNLTLQKTLELENERRLAVLERSLAELRSLRIKRTLEIIKNHQAGLIDDDRAISQWLKQMLENQRLDVEAFSKEIIEVAKKYI
ncbi:hypothetical protein, partial [Allocoleopsis sp.]|uniref:hypothetical protein n=1 Tax=Allocoleopsis sp. TaxID=3088169 RepID=UPI002FD22C1B